MTVTEELITLDVDWAPDFAIDFAAELLAAAGVKATWLVTHASPAIERLAARHDLFELGIHPNFASGSSHGDTPEAVLDHCLRLVPGARTMRAHSHLISSPLLNLVAARTPIVADLTIFLSHAALPAPVPYTYRGRTIYRLWSYWEDDYEFAVEAASWNLADHLDEAPGLKIFNFHPIHVYLNSPDEKAYEELKTQGRPLASLAEETARPFVHEGAGTRTLFSTLAGRLAERGGGRRVSDLVPRTDA